MPRFCPATRRGFAPPFTGNARILETVERSPRLHAAWAALPPGSPDEQLDGPQLLAAMRSNKVSALYLLPTQYRYTLSDWCLDALLEPLAAARVPVIVCFDEVGRGAPRTDQTDWNAVVALCRRWPRLPVIVTEWRIRRSQRLIYKVNSGNREAATGNRGGIRTVMLPKNWTGD